VFASPETERRPLMEAAKNRRDKKPLLAILGEESKATFFWRRRADKAAVDNKFKVAYEVMHRWRK